MSRFPNPSQLYGDPLAFAGRNNGFRNRRLITAAGAYSWTVPDDLPIGPDGYGRVKAFAIGPGGNGSGSSSGGGGGFSLAYGIRCRPGDTLSGTVGTVGSSHTTLALAGVTLTANRGSNATPGSASGGDVNTSGGPGTNSTPTGGGTSGTPWGNGIGSIITAVDTVTAPSWPNPGFSLPTYLPTREEGNEAVRAMAMYAEARKNWWDVEDIVLNGQVVFVVANDSGHDEGDQIVMHSILGGGGSVYGPAGAGGGGSKPSGGIELNPITGGPGLVGWYW